MNNIYPYVCRRKGEMKKTKLASELILTLSPTRAKHTKFDRRRS